MDDPNTSLIKLRQLAELLAQIVATKVGLYVSRDEAQYNLLRRLQDQGTTRSAKRPFAYSMPCAYEALQGLTAMRPVVIDPAITFAQLAR